MSLLPGSQRRKYFYRKERGQVNGSLLIDDFSSRVRLGLARASRFFSDTKETMASNMDNG